MQHTVFSNKLFNYGDAIFHQPFFLFFFTVAGVLMLFSPAVGGQSLQGGVAALAGGALKDTTTRTLVLATLPLKTKAFITLGASVLFLSMDLLVVLQEKI